MSERDRRCVREYGHLDGWSCFIGLVVGLVLGTLIFSAWAPSARTVRDMCAESGRARVYLAGPDLEILCTPIDWEESEKEAWRMFLDWRMLSEEATEEGSPEGGESHARKD